MKRSDRLRVLSVSDVLHPYHIGGKETRAWEIYRRAAQHVDVDVATMNWRRPRSPFGRWTDGGVRVRAICPVLPLYTKGRRSLVQAAVFSAACARVVLSRFDVLEADHMPGPQLAVLAAIARVRRKPLVVTWHEVWGEDGWREYLGRAGRLAAAFERRSARWADVNIAASPGTAARLGLASCDPGSIRVISAAANTDEAYVDGTVERDVDILFAGRLIAHKRVDVLIDAAASACAGRPLRVVIVGDGPESAALRSRADAAVHASDGRLTVEFTGTLAERTAVYDLMRRSRVFVSVSQREGFGITILEAGLCGAAVITSDHPDNESRHLVIEGVTGSVVAAGAVEETAEQMLRWVTEGDRAAVAAAAASERSWDDLALLWVAAVADACGRRLSLSKASRFPRTIPPR